MFHPALDILALPAVRPGQPPSTVIRQLTDGADWSHARALILEYLAWAGAATGLDPFAVQPWLREELDHLALWYAPPKGALLLATVNGEPSGVVGVFSHDEGWAELTRLYVTPTARGHRLGERLVRAARRVARDRGCHTVRLETLPGLMDRAIALYRRLGFRPTERFDNTFIKGMLYLECPVAPVWPELDWPDERI